MSDENRFDYRYRLEKQGRVFPTIREDSKETERLCRHIFQDSLKRGQVCGAPFLTTSRTAIRCPSCRILANRESINRSKGKLKLKRQRERLKSLGMHGDGIPR